jgi:hypothetical protein
VTRKKKFRLRLIIYPRFQIMLILINGLLFLAAFSVFLFHAHQSFSSFVEMGRTINLPPEHPYFTFLELQRRDHYASMALTIGLTFAVGLFLVILLSQRLAGPIVRTVGYFKRIEETGQIAERLSFRQNDFFRELPPAVNAALLKLTDDAQSPSSKKAEASEEESDDASAPAENAAGGDDTASPSPSVSDA